MVLLSTFSSAIPSLCCLIFQDAGLYISIELDLRFIFLIITTLQCGHPNLRQHHIIQVCGLRSKIFCQVEQIICTHTDVWVQILGQADGIIFQQGVRHELCGVAFIFPSLFTKPVTNLPQLGQYLEKGFQFVINPNTSLELHYSTFSFYKPTSTIFKKQKSFSTENHNSVSNPNPSNFC